MKKLILLIIILTMTLSGCTLDMSRSAQYDDLYMQYTDYITHDIADETAFHDLMNSITLESEQSNIMIRVEYYNHLNVLLDTIYGSGVVFLGSSSFDYAITSYDLVHMPEDVHSIKYTIYDYQGRVRTGYRYMESEKDDLSILQFLVDKDDPLPPIGIGSSMPISGEPLVLLGYQNRIINAMTMGLMKEQTIPDENQTVYFVTTIPSDAYANGGAILNIKNELIGIQILEQNGTAFAVSVKSILNMIELFNDQYVV